VVPSDDPRSAAISEALASAQPQPALATAGVGWVLVNPGQPVPAGQPDPMEVVRGADLVVDGPDLKLYRLRPHQTGETGVSASTVEKAVLLTAWAITGAALLYSSLFLMMSLFANIPPVSKRNIDGITANVTANDERSPSPWSKD
jgi:predicted metal-binding membrane protein